MPPPSGLCSAQARARPGGRDGSTEEDTMRFPKLLEAAAIGALLVSACSGGGAGGSTAPSAAPDPCAGAAAHSGEKLTLPTDKSKIKIGVAADVGKVDDKNFNE